MRTRGIRPQTREGGQRGLDYRGGRGQEGSDYRGGVGIRVIKLTRKGLRLHRRGGGQGVSDCKTLVV